MSKIYKGLFLFLFVFVTGVAMAQETKEVTGTVTDADGAPVAGATVRVVGGRAGTATDASGEFKFTVLNNIQAITVNAIGYQEQTVSLTGGPLLGALLRSEGATEAGDEVVVVGYGTQTKKEITSAVTTISASAIANQQVTSVGQALQGLAPGVVVVNATGQPGENPQIRIRGIGSINASASPLIVVDGIPYYGAFNSINQNDVESMSVLKDAAATALYGSRAANGVILITTKKGRTAVPLIEAYASTGWSSRAVKEYEFLSIKDYLELAWEAQRNTAIDNKIANPEQYATNNLIRGTNGLRYNPYNVANPIGTDGKLVAGAQELWNTNWTEALTNDPARRNNVGISVSGASENIRYFLSTDYLKQEGYVINSNFERITTRFNGDADLKSWWKLGLNMAVTSSSQNYPTQSGSAFSSAVGWGRIISSIYPLYMRNDQGAIIPDANGQPQYDYGFPITGRTVNANRPVASGSNAVGQRILDKDIIERLQASINTYSELRFTDYLNFRTQFGIDRFVYTNSEYGNPLFGDAKAAGGRYGKTRNLTGSYTWTNMLNFNKTFNLHTLGAQAIYESFSYNQSNLYAQKAGFPVPNLYDLAAGANYEDATSPTYDERLLSYLGRVTYNYTSKYFLEASLRRDGSTRFSPERRWGTFFSVSAAWDIAAENFMQNVTWLDLLKLRASYGEVGNNALLSGTNPSYFPYLSTYETGYNDGTFPGVYIPNFADPNITWEKLGTYNIGLDFAFLNNRISGSIDYFNKNTFDLLGNIVLAPSTGITGISSNIGSLRNSGVELSLLTKNIVKSDFYWETNFNFGTLKNRITEQSQESVIVGSFRRAVGLPMYNFYIAEWAGVNPDNGLPQWYADEKDADGKVTGKKIVNTYAAATRYDMGSALPTITGGLQNSMRYKDIDFSFLINFALGGQILDADYIGLMSRAPSSGYQLSIDMLNRWQKPGDITDVPRVHTRQTDYGNPSTRHLVSGDYARLRNITLGYTIPVQRLISNDIIKQCRIFLQADNMLTWKKAPFSGLDPEVSINGLTDARSTPFKTLTLGLNVRF